MLIQPAINLGSVSSSFNLEKIPQDQLKNRKIGYTPVIVDELRFGLVRDKPNQLPVFSPYDATRLAEAFMPLARDAQERVAVEVEVLQGQKQKLVEMERAISVLEIEKGKSDKKRSVKAQIREKQGEQKALEEKIKDLNALIDESNKLASTSPGNMKRYVAACLSSGTRINLPGEYSIGVLRKDADLINGDTLFKQFGKYLLQDENIKQQLPEHGLPIIIQTATLDSLDQARRFLEKDVIKIHQFDAYVQPANGKYVKEWRRHMYVVPWRHKTENLKKLDFKETVYWPTLHAWMAGLNTPDKLRPLESQLAQGIKTYYIKMPDETAPVLQAAVEKQFEPLRTRLNALEVSRMAYSGRVDVKEVLGSLTIGALVGGGGHQVVHDYFAQSFMAVMILATLIDMIDNWYGEKGAMQSDLQGNGLHMTARRALFGPPRTPLERENEAYLERFKLTYRHLKAMNGPGASIVKRSGKAAFIGGALGSASSPAAGIGIHEMLENELIAAAGGFIATLGTSLSIPVNLRQTVPQLYAATRYKMDDGIIPVPSDVKTEDEKRKYAMGIAKQETVSRIGFKASMKAFSVAPFIGAAILGAGPILLVKWGVPPDSAIYYCQKAYFTIAPAAENLSRGWFTWKEVRQGRGRNGELKGKAHRNMEEARKVIIDSMTRGEPQLTKQEQDKLHGLFGDKWAEKVYDGLVTKLKLPEWKDIKIEIKPEREISTATV